MTTGESAATNLVFTSSILAQQRALGSAVGSHALPSDLTPALMDFVSKRDSAYLGTANAAGLPTVQHRGGPVGFIRKVDDQTIGFADYTGNGHYISYGNLAENPKACLFLMDYENRWRVKIWGEARVSSDAGLLAELTPERYGGMAHRALLFRVLAWDDNCSGHIPIKVDAARVNARIATLQKKIAQLERENAALLEGLSLADARTAASRIAGQVGS